MWEALASLVASLVDSFLKSEKTRAYFAQGLVNVCLFAMFWFAWNVAHTGSFSNGFKAAFPNHLQHENLQEQVQRSVKEYHVINELLNYGLRQSPGAARIRLNIIHDGVSGVTGVDMLRYDVTAGAVRPGRDLPPLVQDQPLNDWTPFLDKLLKGKCEFMVVKDLPPSAMKLRSEQYNVQAFLVCPVVDVEARLLGAVFLSWDQGDGLIPLEELKRLSDIMLNIGQQVAVALDTGNP